MSNEQSEILFVDMDGVMCDIEAGFRAARERNPDEKRPQKHESFF